MTGYCEYYKIYRTMNKREKKPDGGGVCKALSASRENCSVTGDLG